MTPRQYIMNPLGKGSAIASQKVREELDKEFTTLQHDITLKRYFIQGYRLIYHVIIPSRSVKNLNYDVILEFDLEQDPNATSIQDLNFQTFSNCPSFVYTYAHTFYKMNMIPTWLQKKYPKDILSKAPDIRNHYQIIFYERSLYLALRYITRKQTVGIEDSKSMSLALESTQTVYSKVKPFDDIMSAYNRAKKPSKDVKKKDEPKTRIKSKPAIISKPSLSYTKKVKSISTATVKKSKTSQTKKVKKI